MVDGVSNDPIWNFLTGLDKHEAVCFELSVCIGMMNKRTESATVFGAIIFVFVFLLSSVFRRGYSTSARGDSTECMETMDRKMCSISLLL